MSQSDSGAYCTYMQLLDNGELTEKDPDNPAYTIQLEETDPSMQDWDNSEGQPPQSRHKNKKRRVKRYQRMWDHSIMEREVSIQERDEPSDSCHCQWQNN